MLTDIEWTRKPRTYDIDGEYTDNPEIVMSDPMFASTGDEYFQIKTRDEPNTSLTRPYTYLWRRELVEISAEGDELGSFTWEVRMTQYTGYSDWEESINGAPFVPVDDPPTHNPIGSFTWTIQLAGFAPGTYEARGCYAVNGAPLPAATLLGKFDLRALKMAHQTPVNPFDPQEEELPIELTASVVALPSPGSGRVFPDGWAPEAPLTWRLARSDAFSTSSGILGAGNETPTDQEMELSASWDGKNSDEVYATHPVTMGWAAVSAVPSSGAGNYYARAIRTLLVYHRRCECDPLSGECRCYFELSPGAGPIPLGLEYLSFKGHLAAASMGSGWRLPGSAKLKQMVSGDLVYTSESGHVLRWHPGSGGSYVPAREDNNVTAAAGGTSAFRVTFKGQSHRDFDGNGRLVADIDRLGNTVSYSYNGSGHLATVGDGRGRYFYFSYGSRADGQPVQIRVDDPSTGRLIELAYDSNDRLQSVTNAAEEVIEFEYTPDGLLSKQTQIRPTLGDLVVEHEYGGRLLSQDRLPGQLARVYSGDHLWVTPLVEGELDSSICGRTLDTLKDSHGNTTYREENKPTSLYE